MTDTTEPRYKRFQAKEVFGPGSHDIDIELAPPNGVTVLYGKNGAGKTIALELISAWREGDFARLCKYPWQSWTVELTDGRRVSFARSAEANTSKSKGQLHTKSPSYSPESEKLSYSLRSKAGETKKGHFSVNNVDKDTYDMERDRIRRRIVSAATAEETYELEMMYRDMRERRWAEERPRSEEGLVSPKDIMEGLRDFRTECPRVKFVRADRLGAPEGSRGAIRSARPSRMVDFLSGQVREVVGRADQEYRKVSTVLDSSLSNRIFSQVDAGIKGLEERTVQSLLAEGQEIQEQEKLLRTIGLLSSEAASQVPPPDSEIQRQIYSVILSDRRKKLQPLLQVASKSDRLLESLNRKFSPKRLLLDVAQGYRVDDGQGHNLELSALSSGEQHQLVLMHELLFEVAPGSLILIDEPELSLHVDWQHQMMEELEGIARISGVDFLLATHSPYVVDRGNPTLVHVGPPR